MNLAKKAGLLTDEKDPVVAACEFGNLMIKAGYFAHAHNDHLLLNEDVFYRFNPDYFCPLHKKNGVGPVEECSSENSLLRSKGSQGVKPNYISSPNHDPIPNLNLNTNLEP